MGWGWRRRGLTMRVLWNCRYFTFPGKGRVGH